MMGRTHMAVTAVTLYCCTADPTLTAIGTVSACLPDQAEKYLPFCKHRGITHWLLIWGGLTILLLYPHLFGLRLAITNHLVWKVVTGIVLGGLCHVLQDCLSFQGVPIVRGLQVRCCLYSTGTKSEYFIAILVCLSFIGYHLHTQSSVEVAYLKTYLLSGLVFIQSLIP